MDPATEIPGRRQRPARLFPLLRTHRQVEAHLELFFARLNANEPFRIE